MNLLSSIQLAHVSKIPISDCGSLFFFARTILEMSVKLLPEPKANLPLNAGGSRKSIAATFARGSVGSRGVSTIRLQHGTSASGYWERHQPQLSLSACKLKHGKNLRLQKELVTTNSGLCCDLFLMIVQAIVFQTITTNSYTSWKYLKMHWNCPFVAAFSFSCLDQIGKRRKNARSHGCAPPCCAPCAIRALNKNKGTPMGPRLKRGLGNNPRQGGKLMFVFYVDLSRLLSDHLT